MIAYIAIGVLIVAFAVWSARRAGRVDHWSEAHGLTFADLDAPPTQKEEGTG